MIFELPMCPADFSKMWKTGIWATEGVREGATRARSGHFLPVTAPSTLDLQRYNFRITNHNTTAPIMSPLDKPEQSPPMVLRQPVEGITIIFSLVDPADLKSLRQTCREFDTVAASFLFRCITISRLRTCHDVFFHICDCPHLASHVSEVVWNELAAVNLASAISHHWAQSKGVCLRDDEGEELGRRLSSMASDSDLFWLPPPDTSSPEDLDGDAAVFRRRFVDALRRLPKLNSFVSRPMPTEKCLRPGESALTAGFARNAAVDHDPTNRGFFDFLVPSMFHLGDRITELQFIDEAPPNLLGCSKSLHAAAFAHLTSIQICSDRWNSHPQLVLDDPDVVRCLQAASELQDLRLVMDGPQTAGNAIFSWIFTIDDRTREAMKWRHLHSLSLDGFEVKGEDLVSFVRVHVATLRHLRTVDVWITLETIENIRAITELQLFSFRIEYSRGFCLPFIETSFEEVSERDLLPYVNGCTPESPVPNVPKQSSICTRYYEWHTIQQLGPFHGYSTFHGSSYREADHASGLLSYDMDYMQEDWESDISWTWGRFYHQKVNGTVFFWTIPEGESESYRTETWRVTRNGQDFFFQPEKRILEPPEEYFENWDSAVDRIEATPYRDGFNFDRAESLDELMGPGQADILEKLKARKPPPGAMEWRSEDDPYWLLAHGMATSYCDTEDGITIIERKRTHVGESEGSDEPPNTDEEEGRGQPGTGQGIEVEGSYLVGPTTI